MSYRIPYNQLPNLGTLQEDDIVPGLRPAFEEGSMTVGDLKLYINPVKVFRATMTQEGTNAPFVNTIFENTIGEITWIYYTNGIYFANIDGDWSGIVPQTARVFFNKSVSSDAFYYEFIQVSSNLELHVMANDYTLTNDLLKETFIEILYYPPAL